MAVIRDDNTVVVYGMCKQACKKALIIEEI